NQQGLKSCYCYKLMTKDESIIESRFMHDKYAVSDSPEAPLVVATPQKVNSFSMSDELEWVDWVDRSYLTQARTGEHHPFIERSAVISVNMWKLEMGKKGVVKLMQGADPLRSFMGEQAVMVELASHARFESDTVSGIVESSWWPSSARGLQ
ncbi:CYPRO4 protein, partial [Tanacetum coccineum]